MAKLFKKAFGGSKGAAARKPGSVALTGIDPGEQGSNQPDNQRNPRRGRGAITPLGGRLGNL